MSLDQNKIVEACRELWQSALGLDLQVRGNGESGSDESTLASYVKISGDWKGAVLLECPESVTRHASAMLFGMDPEGLPTQELQDTVDELARMVGKNLQQILAPSGKTSSPRATQEGTGNPVLAAMRGVMKLDLDCEGRALTISVLESEPVPAA